MMTVVIAAMQPLISWALGEVTLKAPNNGWRNSAGQQEEYEQRIQYPASSVNVQSGQAQSALIAGQIKGLPKIKNQKPYTLVVNGVAMPQRVESDGSFQRPYAFVSGSNNVELKSSSGQSVKRTQFYEAYTDKSKPRLRVVLSWDTDQTDLDLHVISPDGQHAWYGGRVLDNGGALDVDVTTGYGPEIFSSPSPVKGTYLVYVNYYGSGERRDVITVAKVSIITNENTLNEKQQTFIVPMRKPGELTLVKSFVYP